MISIEYMNRVAVLTLNRPESRNALTPSMFEDLVTAIREVGENDEARVVVVTGHGRAFSAGADLSAGADTFRFDDADGEFVDPGGRVALELFCCPKPVIGMINGDAIGAGASMTLPMDIRLAAPTARFGFVFTRRGIVPDGCSSWFLPRVVGISTAVEWMTTGRIIDAETALRCGLVRGIHEPRELLDTAFELADEIIRNTAPVSVAMSRLLLWRMLGSPDPAEALRIESLGLRARGASGDAREGVLSFLEKREPQFPGLVSESLPDFHRWLGSR